MVLKHRERTGSKGGGRSSHEQGHNNKTHAHEGGGDGSGVQSSLAVRIAVLNGLFSVMETAVKRLISVKSGTLVQRGINVVVRRVHFQRTKEHPPKTDSTRRKTDCFV